MIVRLAAAMLLVATAGCGLVPGLGMDAPKNCAFPDGTKVTVVGTTPIGDLGLLDRRIEVAENDPPGGTVYVTTQPITRIGDEAPALVWCVIYGPDAPDGYISGSGVVPDGWTRP